MPMRLSLVEHRTDGTRSVSERDLDSVLAGAASSAPIAFAQMPIWPVNGSVVAAGSTIADATQLAAGVVMVTGADGTKGAKLPSDAAGQVVVLLNFSGASILKVYPFTTSNGGAINNGTSVNIPANAGAIFVQVAASNVWLAVLT